MSGNPRCVVLTLPAEKQAAQDIVRRVYAAQGYDLSEGVFVRFLRTPNAVVWGLFEEDVLFGTISIIPDSEAGLPMDSLYAEELAPFRAEGKKIAEVVQFAIDHTLKKPSPFEAVPLLITVLSYARTQKIDTICISIHPKHSQFYHMLGFEKIGDLKQYQAVAAPAVAYALPLVAWETNPFFGNFLRNAIRPDGGVSSGEERAAI
ncbi:MAG: hypothetical protein AAB442_00130 [Patescibacteria group bacterium]